MASYRLTTSRGIGGVSGGDLAVLAFSRYGTAAVFWAVAGEINAPEIALGTSALVTALIVERVPPVEEG